MNPIILEKKVCIVPEKVDDQLGTPQFNDLLRPMAERVLES